jgi:hypothetical protein
MNLGLAAAAVLVLALAGTGVLRIIWPASRAVPLPARLALGYGVGCGFVTLIFFAAYLAGIPFSRWLLIAPTVALAFVGAPLRARPAVSRPQGRSYNLSVLLAAALCVLALALSWSRPVYSYDALSMWALKAKVAFFAKTWPDTMFDRFTTHHPEYPPLVPSAQAFVFFTLNGFDDVASRVIFAGFFAAGAAILWWWLGNFRASARGLWLLWWCALPVMMEQVKITYADLPLAVYLLVFFGAVVSWLRQPQQTHWLRLAGLFGGFAFWVKQDALIGVGAGFVALILVAWMRRLTWRPVITAASCALLIAAPWRVLVWWKQLPADFGWPAGPIMSKLGLIGRELACYAFIEGAHAFFWPVFVVTILFCAKRLRKTENFWLAAAIVAEVAGIFVVYLCSTVDLAAQLKTSADRILLNVFVPALLLVALMWRGSFALLRPRPWHIWAAAVVLAIAAGQFALGLHRKGAEEIAGIDISPFPAALSWVWIASAAVTLAAYARKFRSGRVALVWRAVRFAIVVATLGLAVVAVGVRSREAGELRRRFGGRPLAEQHAIGIEPWLRELIDVAYKTFSEGARVRVTPKRSLRYHIFQYETYPRLIVDDTAAHSLKLEPNVAGQAELR